MTQPYDFKLKQSIVPKWEELLLFNDSFEKVFEIDKNKNVVIFFEILDFLPMSVANKNYTRYGQKGIQITMKWCNVSYSNSKVVGTE